MEKRSTHYGDLTKWIERVIDSCETYQQTFTARKLISNFENKLSKEKSYSRLSWVTTDVLRNKLDIKRNQLLNSNKEKK